MGPLGFTLTFKMIQNRLSFALKGPSLLQNEKAFRLEGPRLSRSLLRFILNKSFHLIH
jgi:hypothetical protein